MAEPVTDLLMMISVDGKDGVPAGSTSSVNAKDAINEGFVEGRYFELEEFGFGLKLQPQEGRVVATDPGQVMARPAGANGGTGGGAVASPGDKDFGIWRSVKADEHEPVLPYRCKPEAFSIKRLIDNATPVLFAHCAKRQEFARAVIIKRFRGYGEVAAAKSSTVGGIPKMHTFLRMEFASVMLTSMDWSDGEVVSETSRFTFQTFKAIFVQQNDDGSAGRQTQGSWIGPKQKTARG